MIMDRCKEPFSTMFIGPFRASDAEAIPDLDKQEKEQLDCKGGQKTFSFVRDEQDQGGVKSQR
jgi:hypothetical protein